MALALNFSGHPEKAIAHIDRAWEQIDAAQNAIIARSKEEAHPAELVELMQEVHYEAACIYSRAGRQEEALSKLQRALLSDSSMTAWAREDPELAGLRTARAMEFHALTRVRWTWTRGTGPHGDQIIVTNKSRFPLHDVILVLYVNGAEQSELGPLEVLEGTVSVRVPSDMQSGELTVQLLAREN